MRRDRDNRVLEFQPSADGGGLLVQEDDPARQSVYLTSRELRWLAWRLPLAWVTSFWARDGGAVDALGLAGYAIDEPVCAAEGCRKPVIGFDPESGEHYCASHEGPF